MNTRLQMLLEMLRDESNQWLGYSLPVSDEDGRRLFRSLRNIREPRAVSAEFLKLQDEELQLQLREKGIVEIQEAEVSQTHPRMRLWKGDITRLHVDAIVNAANSQMLGCFVAGHNCIDNAIHSAAGVQLREACAEIMRQQGHDEPTGSAQITPGFNLPARYVLHTVGPIIANGIPNPEQELQLASCYSSCLAKADEYGLKSIAFCCISTGVFRFPKKRAAEIAVSTVEQYLELHPSSSVKTIIFNVFSDDDYTIYKQILS